MSAIFIGLFIGLFLLLMLFGIYIQSVFADEYGTIGIRHPTNPIICVFEPDPTHTEDVEGVLKASYTSIGLWKDALSEHSPNGNWDMIMATIDLRTMMERTHHNSLLVTYLYHLSIIMRKHQV